MNASELNLPKTIYSVIRSLIQKRIFSPNPDNIVIERVDREPIYPCGRSYGPDVLDLSQLEWAAKEGRFWFLGPIKSVRIIIDKDPIEGELRLEIERMMFTTSFSILNYENFEAVVQRLREVSKQLGLGIEFKQPSGTNNVILTISLEKPLSEFNLNDFLEKIHILHQSTEQ